MSKYFIDEFKKRLKFYPLTRTEELARLLQHKLKTDTTIGDSYYTANLMRLYTLCTKTMKKRGMERKYLKKEFL